MSLPILLKTNNKRQNTNLAKKMRESHSAEKNFSKKFLAKARTRTSEDCTDEYT